MTGDWFLLKSALRDLARGKSIVAAAILVLCPAALAIFWRVSDGKAFPADVAYGSLCAGLVFGFVLVILAVVFGTGAISQEIENKTIVYLVTHALPRGRILLVKFIASCLATTVTAWAACGLLALVVYGGVGHLAGTQVARDFAILPLGAIAYNALFVLLATLINRPLIVGLIFAFGWESWVPSMPGDFGKLSLMAYLRVLAPHPQPASDSVDLSSLFSALTPPTISTQFAWEVVLILTAFCLTAAVLRFSTAEYVPKEDTG